MPKHSRLLLAGLVWVAAYFRIPALFANHYHADEALFSSWARLIAVWRDPLLASQSIDKPPLLFYLQALFFPLMGAAEWTSRLPGLISSLLLVPLIAILGWRLYRDPAASLLAALFVALSPMAIQYSATAFTDPLLATLLILALLLVAEPSNPAMAGLVFGLAVATKYQAWLFLPLLVGFILLNRWDARQWRRGLAGFLPVFLTLISWEIARTGAPIIWSNQISNFGGLRLIYSWELWPRLFAWIEQWQVVFGSSWLLALFAFTAAGLLLNALRSRSRSSRIDLILILYFSFYFILHWLLAVPVWDRYLLPILPLATLLLARGIVLGVRWIDNWYVSAVHQDIRRFRWLILALLIFPVVLFLQIPAANSARLGQWPTGGQPTADQGAWQIAQYLADEPYGTVLYDHWYSWHWQYHFFDKGVYISWFPQPTALAEDLAAFGEGEGSRYIVLPDTVSALPIHRAIGSSGFKLDEEFHTDYQPGLILYRVQQQ